MVGPIGGVPIRAETHKITDVSLRDQSPLEQLEKAFNVNASDASTLSGLKVDYEIELNSQRQYKLSTYEDKSGAKRFRANITFYAKQGCNPVKKATLALDLQTEFLARGISIPDEQVKKENACLAVLAAKVHAAGLCKVLSQHNPKAKFLDEKIASLRQTHLMIANKCLMGKSVIKARIKGDSKEEKAQGKQALKSMKKQGRKDYLEMINFKLQTNVRSTPVSKQEQEKFEKEGWQLQGGSYIRHEKYLYNENETPYTDMATQKSLRDIAKWDISKMDDRWLLFMTSVILRLSQNDYDILRKAFIRERGIEIDGQSITP